MEVKHKKTRKQKIIADYRRSLYSLENKNSPLNMPVQTFTVNAINKDSYSYTYVNDVLKTGLLTSCIIAFQLILFFVLKKHIFSIPNLNY